ncbi:MAG: hypothetical protein HYX84_08285 [Chloroflexi bacterium]|nr:hypothetical protein [Chloroflexota bacterium]
MLQEFDPAEQIYLSKDQQGIVRELLHFEKPFVPKSQFPQLVAREYLERFGRYYQIPAEELAHLDLEPERDLIDARVEYRFLEMKEAFDTVTVGIQQTYFGIPVWRAGLSVTLRKEPLRVVSSQSTAHTDIQVRRPRATALRRSVTTDTEALSALALPKTETARVARETTARLGRLVSSRLIIYRYDAAKRVSDEPPQVEPAKTGGPGAHPTLPLPPVADSISDGAYYVCREIIFAAATPEWGEVTWDAIMELETGSVLYLRPFVDNVDGLLFLVDPITGGSGVGPASNNATLNPVRVTAALPGLSAPAPGSNQALTGNFVQVSDFEQATAAPPTQPVGSNFNYNSRTNDFAAVNAYYHCDRFFRLVQDLGFNISTYFNGTAFPIPVDHRGRYGSLNGIEINASCSGNGAGGIANVDFELADLGDTTNPIGIAADWRIVLHELGGHGILYDHVNSANFGFAHSAGDSFGAILCDPDTQAPDRFLTFPWVSGVIARRHDRSVAAGWGWGGVNDTGAYNSEQILCTTNFRIYRSIGGDAANANTRRFAARYMAYLMLRAVSTLTPATNPTNALGFANALLTADQGDWTSEGHSGGAYGKVVRWAFEKQGLYQPAGAPTPVISAGAPPAIDVYIDDGRGGEYQYVANFWNNQNVWNRRNNDGGAAHEEPIVGATNYAYVKIKNRGTQTATNVIVKGFHCKPSAGLVWPNDWQAMTTAQLSAANIPPNNSAEITVGPFEWVPTEVGHECMLMIVSATGDPSNISNFTAGDSIPHWRLVPHDNNIGQRNVVPIAGGGGIKGLLASITRRKFWLNNPHPRKARMEVSVKLPALLRELGWSLSFENAGGASFSLAPGQSKEMIMTLKPGKDFSAAQIESIPEAERNIDIEANADGILVGGMSYKLDPALKSPLPQKPGEDVSQRPLERIDELLECLKLKSENIESVKVRRITIDINFKDDCC